MNNPDLKGFLFDFELCFCFSASVLKSVTSLSAVISLCLPRGTKEISEGGAASYTRGNSNAERLWVAMVATVLWSHKDSWSFVYDDIKKVFI